MSAPENANPCCSTAKTTQYPGVAGDKGDAGTNGINAFTLLSSALVLPTSPTDALTASVADSTWMAVGEVIFFSDGTNFAHVRVTSKPSAASVSGVFLRYPGNAADGVSIGIGAIVTPSGIKTPLSAALPNALTDNSTGTQSDTIAAGVGVFTLPFFVNLADLANHDLVTTLTLGYKFKILGVSFVVEKPATTGSKLATITPYINGAAVTGGVLALTSGNCTPQGVVVAGSAVTAANTGDASATLSLTASSVTAFIEGSGWIVLKIQNTDSADAVASLAKHVNDLITALT